MSLRIFLMEVIFLIVSQDLPRCPRICTYNHFKQFTYFVFFLFVHFDKPLSFFYVWLIYLKYFFQFLCAFHLRYILFQSPVQGFTNVGLCFHTKSPIVPVANFDENFFSQRVTIPLKFHLFEINDGHFVTRAKKKKRITT